MPDLVADNKIQVVACPNPFNLDRMEFYEEARVSLYEILCRVQPKANLRQKARIAVNGEPIHHDDWVYFYPAPGSYIDIRVVPREPISAIIIGIAAIAAQLGVTSAAAGFGPVIAGILGALAGAVVSVVGYLLMAALVRPPSISSGQRATEMTEDTPTKYLSGARNRAVPYGVVPRVYGKIRMVPPLAATYYSELSNVESGRAFRPSYQSPYWTALQEARLKQDLASGRALVGETQAGEWTGEEQWLRMLVTWGLGPLEVTDFRIADTPLEDFQGAEWEHRAGYAEDTRVTLYSKDVYEEDLNIQLTKAGGVQYRTTQDNIDEFSVDLAFNGLYEVDRSDGGKDSVTVNFTIYYKKDGDAEYSTAGQLSVRAARMSAIRRGFRFVVPTPGRYSVGIERTTNDHDSTDIVDDSYWGALRSIKYEYPVKETRVALTALRIKASDQLSGAVDEFNGIAYSIIRDWDKDSQQWIRRKTKNPASHYLHILTDPDANPDYLPDSRVNMENLQEFHEFCEENKFYCNVIFDSSVSVENALDLVAGCGRAARAMPAGKHGVVIDKKRDIIAQHFTPRNSWNFSATQAFIRDLHAFRCPFIDEDNDWKETEVTVYADGYDESNATKFEELKLEGVTNYDQLYKLARYYLAVAEYQREMITFKTDFEYLTCERGSRIVFSHDVMLIGLSSGRLKGTDTDGLGFTDRLYFDDPVTVEPGSSYAVQVRLYDGEALLIPVTNPATTSQIVVDNLEITTPINPGEQTEPRMGDLFSFGESGLVTQDLLVLGIEPEPDLTASLLCTIYDDAVYEAADGPIPTYVPKISVPVEWRVPVVAGIYSDGSVLYWAQGSWQSRILVTFSFPPIMPGYWGIEGQIRRYEEEDSAWRSVDAPLSEREISFTQVDDGATYEMRFRYIKTSGYRGTWTESTTHTVEGKTGPPADVTGFHVYQDSGIVVLKWSEVADHDLKEYKIKYSAAGLNTWETATVLTTAAKGTTKTDKSLPQGYYDFFIKAIDLSGNESENAAAVYSVRVVETFIPIWQLFAGSYPDGTQYSISGHRFDCEEHEAGAESNPYNLIYDYSKNIYRAKNNMDADDYDDLSVFEYYCSSPATPQYYETWIPGSAQVANARIWIQADGYVPWWKEENDGFYGSWEPTFYTKAWLSTESEPSEWTEGQSSRVGDGSVKAYKFRCRVDLPEAQSGGLFAAVLRNVTYAIDMQPVVCTGTDTIAVGGTTIKYGQNIGYFPNIVAQVIGGDGFSVKVTSVSAVSCKFTVYDETGTDVGGEIYWVAQTGFGSCYPGG